MNRKKTFILVLENIRSVENVGSIFRSADRFGVSKIILIGTSPTPLDRFGRKRSDFIKVSLGAEKTVPWEYSKEIGGTIDKLKNSGFQIVSLEQAPGAKNIKNFKGPENVALVVGNEVRGISKETLKNSDVILEIAIWGEKRSLNVSVATGIALFVLLSDHA